jgi:large subunit ribosomal protein L3
MGGRMGGERVTVKNVTVRIVDIENQIIALEGAVPGKRNSFLTIRKK